MGAAICMTGLSDPPHKKKISVGRTCQDPEFKIKIEDEDGNECPTGEAGELVVYSPFRMINYLTDKEKDPVSWIRSGDKAYVDTDGFVHIVGRIKDTITLKNAKKINASLVEELLISSKGNLLPTRL